MDIEAELRAEHSRKQSGLIATHVLADSSARFAQLVDLMLGEEAILANRAAWTAGHCLDESPALADPHLPRFLDRLESTGCTEPVKRNLCRVLQFITIPPKELGRVFEICYHVVANPGEAVAARAYSMSVLTRICEREPELAGEVMLLIRQNLEGSSAGFRARARKEIKRLEKLAGKGISDEGSTPKRPGDNDPPGP